MFEISNEYIFEERKTGLKRILSVKRDYEKRFWNTGGPRFYMLEGTIINGGESRMVRIVVGWKTQTGDLPLRHTKKKADQ